MSTARYIVGDVLEVLRSLPDDSVDLVLTSPPFLALRSYLPADHPDKAKELGSEPTPGAFIDALLDVVEECARVLAPHGSLCIELGDTYAGSGGAGGDYGPDGLREGQEKFKQGRKTETKVTLPCRHYDATVRVPSTVSCPECHQRWRIERDGEGIVQRPAKNNDARFRAGYQRVGQIPQAQDYEAFDVRPARGRTGWPQDKSLTLVPELFRISLAYGVNPLTGRTTDPWRIRNVVRWVRPNPPVGALGDKFRPATSEMVVATKSRTRYFDLDSVRSGEATYYKAGKRERDRQGRGRAEDQAAVAPLDHGAPPLDWWAIPTEPYPGSHYATWPRDLLVRPIKAMCPERVCRVCGEPSRRIVGEAEYVRDGKVVIPPDEWRTGRGGEVVGNGGIKHDGATTRRALTLGWTECPCDDRCSHCDMPIQKDTEGLIPYHDWPKPTRQVCPGSKQPPKPKWRPGVVLDPFAGSGTTLAVATGHGRDAIGIDLDESNAPLAEQRVGMFLEVVHHAGSTPHTAA